MSALPVWWFVAALAAALVSTFLTGRIASSGGARLLDVPNERSLHERATPRAGGLAIIAVVIGGVFAYMALASTWAAMGGYLVGASLIAAVSFAGDLGSLPPTLRLTIHAVAALIAIGAYTDWRGAAFPMFSDAPAFAALLTFLWIIGLTNAYNFMDGTGGIAGVQAVIAGIAWCVAGLMLSHPSTILIALLITGAGVGFLRYNWPPARIVMGDVGSACLGYTLAVIPLVAGASVASMTVATFVVGTFLSDTIYTFVRRLTHGEDVFRAHWSHFYQRLALAGHTHREVTLLYGVLATFLACVGLFLLVAPDRTIIVGLTSAAIAALVLQVTVSREERKRSSHTVHIPQ